MESIKSELESEIQKLIRVGTLNYWAAYVLSAIAVLTSILAGLIAAGQWGSRPANVILSTAPGAVLIVMDRFKIEDRWRWRRQKMYAARGLLYQLCFEGKPEKEVSAEWRRISGDLESFRPGFGAKPTGQK